MYLITGGAVRVLWAAGTVLTACPAGHVPGVGRTQVAVLPHHVG